MVTSGHSDHAVFSLETPSGFVNKIFVMYHSTSTSNAESIIREGKFRPSAETDNMLGAGVYASHTYQKALNHGIANINGKFVIFELLVYVGRVFKVTEKDDPMNKRWHKEFSSAWLKPNANLDMAKSGLQENCVKSPKQICILGVCSGYHFLTDEGKTRTIRLKKPRSRGLNHNECMRMDKEDFWKNPQKMMKLKDFSQKLGLTPFPLENSSHMRLNCLADVSGSLLCLDYDASDGRMLWVKSGDGCIENASTGRFLTWNSSTGDIDLIKWDYREAAQIRGTHWKTERSGALFNRAGRGYLRIRGTEKEICLQKYRNHYYLSRFEHFRSL